MAILIITAVLVVVLGAGLYGATTRRCLSGNHSHRHWRFGRHHRHGPPDLL